MAHRQLVALGVSAFAVQHRLRAGKLHQLHVGVYAVGHTITSTRGRWMAAALACGPGSVLSHRSAAMLWALRPAAGSLADVTVPRGSRRNRPRIAVHRTRRLDPEDRAVVSGIPVTTVARTLLDIAEVMRPSELTRALESAERLRLLDQGAIEETAARCPGRRGLRPLAAALDAYRPVPDTRSELERLFTKLCRDGGFPPPATNVMVAGLLVDAVWLDARLVVELDGRSYHSTHEAFERDRVRDATLQLAGYRVVRLTYRRLVQRPEEVAGTLRSLLAAAE